MPGIGGGGEGGWEAMVDLNRDCWPVLGWEGRGSLASRRSEIDRPLRMGRNPFHVFIWNEWMWVVIINHSCDEQLLLI